MVLLKKRMLCENVKKETRGGNGHREWANIELLGIHTNIYLSLYKDTFQNVRYGENL